MPTNTQLEQMVKELSAKLEAQTPQPAVQPVQSEPVTEEPSIEETYCPPAYKEAANKILGKDFGFGVEEIGSQEMVVVTVPDKYRDRKQLDAYLSHWKGKRKLYENELTRVNPNISFKDKQDRLAEYDAQNPDPVIPKDQRHKAMSAIKTVVDLNKWLLLVRQNIKRDLATAKSPDEMPINSLQDELAN